MTPANPRLSQFAKQSVISAAVAILATILVGFAAPAHAEIECKSQDQQSDLALRHTPLGPRLTIHSSELSLYTQVAYGFDLDRLEIVLESDGNPVLNLSADGFTAMAYAPSANRPDLIWSVEFKRSSPLKTNTSGLVIPSSASAPSQWAGAGSLTLTDVQGHKTEIQLICQ